MAKLINTQNRNALNLKPNMFIGENKVMVL